MMEEVVQEEPVGRPARPRYSDRPHLRICYSRQELLNLKPHACPPDPTVVAEIPSDCLTPAKPQQNQRFDCSLNSGVAETHLRNPGKENEMKKPRRKRPESVRQTKIPLNRNPESLREKRPNKCEKRSFSFSLLILRVSALRILNNPTGRAGTALFPSAITRRKERRSIDCEC